MLKKKIVEITNEKKMLLSFNAQQIIAISQMHETNLEAKSKELNKTNQDLQKVNSINKTLTEKLYSANQSTQMHKTNLEAKSKELNKTEQDLQEVKSINRMLTEKMDLAKQSVLEINAFNNAIEDRNDKLISDVQKLKDEITVLSNKEEELSKDYQSKLKMLSIA